MTSLRGSKHYPELALEVFDYDIQCKTQFQPSNSHLRWALLTEQAHVKKYDIQVTSNNQSLKYRSPCFDCLASTTNAGQHPLP